MKETKRETFLYEGLGFPIRMVNVPMKKIFGEWVMNINFAELQRVAMLALAKKPIALTGRELRSIRHYLHLSTHKFAEELGVTHVAILHWEGEERKMNPDTEINLRLFLMNHLEITDREFRQTYSEFNRKKIASRSASKTPLEIDAEKIAC